MGSPYEFVFVIYLWYIWEKLEIFPVHQHTAKDKFTKILHHPVKEHTAKPLLCDKLIEWHMLLVRGEPTPVFSALSDRRRIRQTSHVSYKHWNDEHIASFYSGASNLATQLYPQGTRGQQLVSTSELDNQIWRFALDKGVRQYGLHHLSLYRGRGKSANPNLN